ncbi:MAG: hypothetical protein OXG81_15860 [Acidobacteria bacterium]|nr:hypothetical protein [Acidobacteriota bacterium]
MLVSSLSDVISDGRRGRRGIDADYFLYSVFKEPAIAGRAPLGPSRAKRRSLRPARVTPWTAVRVPLSEARTLVRHRRPCQAPGA